MSKQAKQGIEFGTHCVPKCDALRHISIQLAQQACKSNKENK